MDKAKLKNELLKDIYRDSFIGSDMESKYMGIIGAKVLKIDSGRITIDIERLFDEFRYFKHYSSMSDNMPMNFFLPIIIASRNFESYGSAIVDICDKVNKFYSSTSTNTKDKYSILIEVRMLDILIREITSDESFDVDGVLDLLREELVEFSPEYESKMDRVRFQMAKISYIDRIHKEIDLRISGEKDVGNVDIFLEIFGEPICNLIVSAISGKQNGINSTELLVDRVNLEDVEKDDLHVIKPNDYGKDSAGDLHGINPNDYGKDSAGDSNGEDKDRVDIDDISSELIDSLANYIIRVRILDIKTPEYQRGAKPSRFANMNIGEKEIDPILNKFEIVSKKIVDEKYEDLKNHSINEDEASSTLVVGIKCKTGRYNFRFKVRR